MLQYLTELWEKTTIDTPVEDTPDTDDAAGESDDERTEDADAEPTDDPEDQPTEDADDADNGEGNGRYSTRNDWHWLNIWLEDENSESLGWMLEWVFGMC